MKRILIATLLAASALAPSAPAQSTTAGYDSLGRLKCVKYPSGRVTTYSYDDAGNRTSVTTASSGTCTSTTPPANAPVAPQAPPPPPPPAITLTANSPTNTISSRGVSTFQASALGYSSDSATLTLHAAVTGGSAAACGSVSKTTTSFTYTAPLVSPQNATLQCWVDYTLKHPNAQTKTGRATYNINGEPTPPPEEDPGDPPPVEPECPPLGCPDPNQN